MMDVQVEKDLVFATHDGSELALDIYRPRGGRLLSTATYRTAATINTDRNRRG